MHHSRIDPAKSACDWNCVPAAKLESEEAPGAWGVFRVVIRFSRHAGLVRDDYIITANTALVEKAWAYSRSRVLCTAARLGIGDALEDEVRRILTCVWDLTDSQAIAR
jgi:hypothetical protein